MARNDSIAVERQPTPFERLVGECAAELFMDEVEAALKDVDCAELEGVSLDDWFWNTIAENTAKPEQERPQRSLAKRILLYAASFIAFLIVTGVIVLATVEPARAVFLRLLVTRFPQYSEYIIQLYPDDEIKEFEYVEPTYIPVGFRLDSEARYPDSLSLYWLDNTGELFIAYSQKGAGSPISLDTEDAVISTIQIQDVVAEMIQKSNVTTIQLIHADSCYIATTNFSAEECLKIVESLPLK